MRTKSVGFALIFFFSIVGLTGFAVAQDSIGQSTKRFGFGNINQAQFSPDGELIAVATTFGVALLDANNLEEVGFLETSEEIRTLAFGPNGNLAGGSFQTLRIWDVASGNRQITFRANGVSSIAFSPDGKLLAVAGFRGGVELRSVETGQTQSTLGGFSLGGGVAFNSDGTLLVSGTGIWDVSTGEQVAALGENNLRVQSTAFNPDGTLVSTGTADGAVYVWNALTGEQQFVLRGHTSPVTSVAFSPDGKLLASGSLDRTIQLWNVAIGIPTATLEGDIFDSINSIAFSPDGTHLVSASRDGTIVLWDVSTKNPQITRRQHAEPISSVAFSPDGTLLASGSIQDGVVQIRDVAAGNLLVTLQHEVVLFGDVAQPEGVDSIAFSPDGAILASESDSAIILWDVASREKRQTLRSGGNFITFSPDGALLASANSHIIQFWDVATGERSTRLEPPNAPAVFSIAFSPDGAQLASALADKTVLLWDVATGTPQKTLQGHALDVTSVAYSPDGTQLASASKDGTIVLWDVATGEPQTALRGHQDWINAVTYSRDGTYLASASKDNTVIVWEVGTGQIKATLHGHPSAEGRVFDFGVIRDASGFLSLAFSPDGMWLAAGSVDGTVTLWDLNAIGAGAEPTTEDITFPTIVGGDVSDGRGNVDPIKASTDGIKIEFSEPVEVIAVEIAVDRGEALDWVFALAEDKQSVTLLPARGARLLSFQTQYRLTIAAKDLESNVLERGDINFATKSLEEENLSLYYRIASNSDLDSFRSALVATDLDLVLSTEAALTYTILAPNDEAFDKIPESLLEDLLEPANKAQLKRILSGHIIPKQFTFGEISGAPGQALTFETLSDVPLTITGVDRNDFVVRSGEVEAMITSKRQPVLIIDTVLLPSTPAALTGDVNGDNVVNIFDLVQVASQFGQSGENLSGDVNSDGTVNIFDLVEVASHFGEEAVANAPTPYHINPALKLTPPSHQRMRAALSELETIDNPSLNVRIAIDFLRSLVNPEPVITETKVFANYPNPFNPETWIPYQLAAAADVEIFIYNVDGHRIRTVQLGTRPSGEYITRDKAAYWDGRNDTGEHVSSGTYFYHFQAGDYYTTKKMVILK